MPALAGGNRHGRVDTLDQLGHGSQRVERVARVDEQGRPDQGTLAPEDPSEGVNLRRHRRQPVRGEPHRLQAQGMARVHEDRALVVGRGPAQLHEQGATRLAPGVGDPTRELGVSGG